MMTLPRSASKSSTEWGTSGNWLRHLLGDLFKQAVGRFLDRVFGRARDPFAGLAGEIECVRAASRTGRRSTIRRLTAPSSPIIRPGSS